MFNEGVPEEKAVNGQVTIASARPTAATTSVSGIVISASGRPIAKARISLAGMEGARDVVLSNAFGFYQFDQVPVGDTYIVSVAAKRYTFAPQTISVTDQITSLNLIADQ